MHGFAKLMICIIVVMFRNASKKETSKRHERSLDDFMKHLKRYNLRSERVDRYHSPDPYAPYRVRTSTLDRSRTLSGKHSHKTTKTTRKRVQKLLSGSLSKNRASSGLLPTLSQSMRGLPNPADLIAQFTRRIREAEMFLEGKSKMGMTLCRKFLEMLNQIVENMVLNLQQNLQELETSIHERLEKELGEQADKRVAKLQRKIKKLEGQTLKLVEKQNYNSNLIYNLRLQNIDIDRQFGKCIYGSDQYGGAGYNKSSKGPSSDDPISHSQVIFMKRNEEMVGSDVDVRELEWSPGRRRRREEDTSANFS